MNTREEMNKSVENLKEELRERARKLEHQMELNIAVMRNQVEALSDYQRRYNNGHVTLSELIDMHEALVKAIPSLMLGYPYSKAKLAYTSLDADITNIQNFVNTLE